MRQFSVLVLTLCVSPFCVAQEGVTPAWQLRSSLDALVAHTKRLAPLLEETKPAEWVKDGASGTYIEQSASARNEIEYVTRAAAALSADPEKMSLALEVYLKLETLEMLLDSLSEGVRRYQNPALADLIQGVVAENGVNRARLRNYLSELVVNKELELRIMNEEAQRCRGQVIRQPKPAAKKK
ncbi:MAG: hypothetical protein R2762_22365 [Bryobacteraceae bacterium]